MTSPGKPRPKPGFSTLTHEALEQFEHIAQQVAHPNGSIVFKEGDPVNGIYLVCDGIVKIYATSHDGHTMTFRIARTGDVLGLSATLNDLPYEVTAKTLGICTLKHIGQHGFLKFLAVNAEAGYTTALTLAKEHRELSLCARRLALSPSASARIAQVLIGFSTSDNRQKPVMRFPVALTHAEIASLAGTSRETVTRLLNRFEREGIISRDNAIIAILQPSRMKELAH